MHNFAEPRNNSPRILTSQAAQLRLMQWTHLAPVHRVCAVRTKCPLILEDASASASDSPPTSWQTDLILCFVAMQSAPKRQQDEDSKAAIVDHL